MRRCIFVFRIWRCFSWVVCIVWGSCWEIIIYGVWVVGSFVLFWIGFGIGRFVVLIGLSVRIFI